jgi:8-oxo-dGTP diphosphatase
MENRQEQAVATEGPQVIRVVGAAIVRDGRIFCAQRNFHKQVGGKWEFPGGKIKPGETPQQALRREIHEELRSDVRVGRRVHTTDNRYPFGTVELSTYLCTLEEGDLILTEHEASRWMRPKDLPNLDWAPADVEAMHVLSSLDPNELEQEARQEG